VTPIQEFTTFVTAYLPVSFNPKTNHLQMEDQPLQCCQANLSKMNGSRVLQGDLMRVFKEGVNLFIDNYWHRFGIEKNCASNPTPMLQYLADIIFFWFTQTISKQIKLIT
jgi:hypothetical protein